MNVKITNVENDRCIDFHVQSNMKNQYNIKGGKYLLIVFYSKFNRKSMIKTVKTATGPWIKTYL